MDFWTKEDEKRNLKKVKGEIVINWIPRGDVPLHPKTAERPYAPPGSEEWRLRRAEAKRDGIPVPSEQTKFKRARKEPSYAWKKFQKSS